MHVCLFIGNKLTDEFDDDSRRYVRQLSPAFNSEAAASETDLALKPLTWHKCAPFMVKWHMTECQIDEAKKLRLLF